MISKLLPIAVVALCLVLSPSLAAEKAPSVPASYRFSAAVTVKAPQASLYVAELPADVLRRMEGRYSDLRLIDGSGAEVPYKLDVRAGRKADTRAEGEILNKVRKPGRYSEVTFRMLDQKVEVNHLAIDTPSRNFRYRLSLEGSNDLGSWLLITDQASIFDYTEDVHLQKLDFTFNKSLYGFYRLRVFDSDKTPLAINGIEFTYLEDRPAELVPLSVKVEEWKELDGGKLSVALISPELTGRELPLGGVTIETRSEHFSRTVSIGLPGLAESMARGQSDSGKQLASFEISRIRSPKLDSEQLSHSFDSLWVPKEFELIVENRDDPPLKDPQLKFSLCRHLLYFPGDWKAPLSLFVGNEKAQSPAYEFEKLFQYEAPAGAQAATIGPARQNKAYVPPPPPSVWERVSTSPKLLYSAFGLAALVVLLLIFKALRRPGEPG